MAKHVLVIHNPTAGWLRRHRFVRFLTVLAELGHTVELRHTEHAGHAEAIALSVRQFGGCDLVVAAGGDGTVREVVNGLVGSTIPLAVVPLGTANVLAWEIGIGDSIEKAVAVIRDGVAIECRPGMAGGRRFMLMASAGIDSRVVAGISRRAKRLLGKGAYAIGTLRAISTPQAPVLIDADGDVFEAAIAIVTRARMYGGPYPLAPRAGLALPRLWLAALPPSGFGPLAKAGMAMVAGTLPDLPELILRPVDHVRFLGPTAFPWQADGDLAGQLPFAVELDREAVSLLVPAQADQSVL